MHMKTASAPSLEIQSRIQHYWLLWLRNNVEATFEEVGSTAKEGKITLLRRDS